ncbi:hypothetical protein ACSDQ9_04265 [Aestuariimicrobium soli]|uniref:hypothetical protein n=1 Tax=Aestuariimicrobium soli TaxID=2035834 RepID=UPI003EBF3FFB
MLASQALRWRGAAGMVAGVVLLGLAVLVLVIGLVDRGPWQLFVAAVVVGVIGALGLLTGRWILRGGLLSLDGGPTTLPPHAFVITDDSLEFPPFRRSAGESWPRAEVTARIESVRGHRLLALSAPGRRPRRFLASALVLPVDDVLALVRAGGETG